MAAATIAGARAGDAVVAEMIGIADRAGDAARGVAPGAGRKPGKEASVAPMAHAAGRAAISAVAGRAAARLSRAICAG